MPFNPSLVAVGEAMAMVQQSILAVRLALDNNPSPDDAIELMDRLTDLRTLRDELTRTGQAIRDGSATMPPPDEELVSQLETSIRAVDNATIQGTAASSVLKVVGDALALGLAVMSLASGEVAPPPT